MARAAGHASLVSIEYESQLSKFCESTCVRCMMAPPRTAATERIALIPAVRKDSATGYKNVTFSRSSKKFKAEANAGGKGVHLGYFDTVEEAATAYARSEYGRADAATLLQPRPAPTPAGAEAIRQAEREGLTLTASSSSNTGYKGVCCRPKQQGSKKYQLKVMIGGKQVTLGWFATAEEAALFYARREAGRDTSDLTAPPPPSSTSAELPAYELSILTPEQMAANRHIVHRPIWTIVERVGEVFGDRLMIMQQP
ncbi:hypothetical protein EMIHUDRAFT_223768 [Emiliania huxleyi CCMP1516]|uniref:AP2/ERF domain-containing protein n=2 Tax=Emiliania huxleyi TaxID=2903 RepID=A0A0D3KU16_EMIH1|nr:hypothetical protein EMIHUDRAFT_223768 [Emiliania huxleyi CCMP1516]EOD39251.1 hypothetical protein EMIHUDRAFT_223768 [Emiliania huxleyi CCMP1516]|eukprot:XP_005791680.1 hypothetical protein EMIHUDRAFT_223768 [Emiliania huxleyi CCMP1516]